MNLPLSRLSRLRARLPLLALGALVLPVAFADAAWAAEESIDAVIDNLTAWVVGIVAGVATLFFTAGGLRYLMAGGELGEVESAKRALKAAAIGYGVVILAPVIVTVLKGIVGAE
ncbi:pilin [Streptomyces sp. SBT349]|uniref:pilin n=1 Tax=Streptomyces sp. SBT349 TaxID=1580539 RepID=UPI00066CD80A|nr:pilin [Streptomyces sp. SBT349]